LLVSEDERFAELRHRDEQLSDLGWLPAAAVYHFSTRFRGSRVSDVDYERLVDRHGPPPPAFHTLDRPGRELPKPSRQGSLYQVLAARKTTRRFDESRPVSLEQLAIVLFEVFGWRDRELLHDEVEVLKKSSPSSGALHPIEAYPLIRRVEGLAHGLYHYSVRDHALEPISESDGDLVTFTAGQDYFGSAAVAFLLTARFRRSFWKYREHPTAYATLLLDAAHLSQSLYLVCTELGLGAFFTNAINDGDIDDALGLDGIEEGALAVCGCGFSSEA
jgi:putative peptide maturation dehydrogenase